MMLNNRARHFRQALNRIAKTEDGKIILAYMRDDIINMSLKSVSAEDTAYEVGKRDYMQAFIKAAQIDFNDDIRIITEDTQEEMGAM